MGVKNNYQVNLDEVMKTALTASGFNQHKLSIAMGYKQSAGVATVIKNGEAKVSTLARWADVLGYDLVLQPKGQLSEDEIKICVSPKEE
ncbi:MAG: hypothetical protein U0L73_07890 [Ruminococcus bromii]|nr:hypothetical protein [Ruminococcus bromii]